MQVVDTFHYIYEEKYISKYNLSPLLVVGSEGLFGLIGIILLQIPMYYCRTQTFQFGYNPTGRLVDPIGRKNNSQLNITFNLVV